MPRIWQVVNNNGQSAKLICNGEVKIVKRQEAVVRMHKMLYCKETYNRPQSSIVSPMAYLPKRSILNPENIMRKHYVGYP